MKYKMSRGIKVFRNKNGVCRRGITVATRSAYGRHHSHLGEGTLEDGKHELLLAGSSDTHTSSLGDRVVLEDSMVIGMRLMASLEPSTTLGG